MQNVQFPVITTAVIKCVFPSDSDREFLNSVKTNIKKHSYSLSASSNDLKAAQNAIKNCSVYLVCLSDEFVANEQAMSELLYAKKTLGKNVIPLIPKTSQKWSGSVAGMLLAGQLYIQLRNENDDEKIDEIVANLKRLVVQDNTSGPPKLAKRKTVRDIKEKVFLSYCWVNSYRS